MPALWQKYGVKAVKQFVPAYHISTKQTRLTVGLLEYSTASVLQVLLFVQRILHFLTFAQLFYKLFTNWSLYRRNCRVQN